MARLRKATVDYFPHDADASTKKTLSILQVEFGNDGYAFWFKLLELLAASEGHVYNYNKPAQWRFLLTKTSVSEKTANSILTALIDLGAIDAELAGKKIIWCQHFVDGVADAYKRRSVSLPLRPDNRQKNIFEKNQDYLHEHPEEVLCSTGHEFMTAEEIADDNNDLCRGNETLEEHAEALEKAMADRAKAKAEAEVNK